MDFFERTFTQPVMAILRGMEPDRTVELAERAWQLGIDLVEVPIEAPRALPSLRATVQAGADRGHRVGAGTVITPEQVRTASEAGAAFTVAPGLDAEVVDECRRWDLPHLPGVSSPTEIQHAHRLGLEWVKAFPASVLGSSWFAAMGGPFPGTRMVATGGINAHNAPEYLRAGASAVAVGSALEDPEQLPALAELAGTRERGEDAVSRA
ncbi:2-dehydro-3-deoxyphosphogluconate aldolase/(4S)-4-hydroxy-2-oxoglutarate aldolase [Saccharopolyspora lacisalsi]|uniref:2-dehydro-3-deoxyphosphogluconate aldolase/(4S)-4-hydroxy-2-oxoglutarate aldolase n=1 Tax=Halosaccharopolyspora lacisalsi TaxID=1000566 RepID=A0A839DX31_9PSEU|nr:bifunctional 4-hydroxy-2-oxoglutarate aldolase/2-dehydro-3-deoxy-phosphogluconate aldolase [Halosaccharopolyspora lacisalsi]MBA8823298.1 2-dehydro-3-deoxyphosphogluconate aldolase/(4S)-4-hydroxy-2-oxoglutarate aldolase [Halosaccharopolyspora lacisalsi]